MLLELIKYNDFFYEVIKIRLIKFVLLKKKS